MKEQLLVSIKSLYVLAVSSLARGPYYYHIHVLTDATEGSVTADELAFFQPQSPFKLSLHAPYPDAVFGFKTCATERIYLHSHMDFQGLDKVRRDAAKVKR